MPKARKKTPLPKFAWILIGLVIGIASTFFYKEYADHIPSLKISEKVIGKISKKQESKQSSELGEQKFDFYTLFLYISLYTFFRHYVKHFLYT